MVNRRFNSTAITKLDLSEQERKQITVAYRDEKGAIAKRAQEDHALAKKRGSPIRTRTLCER